jgi:alpha-1,2-mannosyltransferase
VELSVEGPRGSAVEGPRGSAVEGPRGSAVETPRGSAVLYGRNWLTRERAIGYATILAITQLGLFAFCVAGAHGLIVPLDHQNSTDFVSFHAAGALADAGTPWLAYNRAAHHAAEQAAIGVATAYNYFYYPPVFLLICAPLALLPYLPAFVLFQAAGAVACLFAVRMIRRDLPVVVLLAFPGLWWAMGTGQNALLTAALFAAGTALLDRRPWLSGLCFGALCYKPHFGLLIPVALVAGGHWRAVLGAASTALALVGASLVLFGLATWEAFLAAAAASGDVYAGHAIFMGGLTSPFGVMMVAGAGREAAFAVQAVATVLAALAVALVWRPRKLTGDDAGEKTGGKIARAALPMRAAILLAATPVAVPVLMFYDLMLVFVALVWLSRVPASGGAVPWRTAAMAAVFMGPLVSGNLSTGSQWMLAAVTAAMAFGLTLAVAWPALAISRFGPVRTVTGAARSRSARSRLV